MSCGSSDGGTGRGRPATGLGGDPRVQRGATASTSSLGASASCSTSSTATGFEVIIVRERLHRRHLRAAPEDPRRRRPLQDRAAVAQLPDGRRHDGRLAPRDRRRGRDHERRPPGSPRDHPADDRAVGGRATRTSTAIVANREGSGWFRRLCAAGFYWTINKASGGRGATQTSATSASSTARCTKRSTRSAKRNRMVRADVRVARVPIDRHRVRDRPERHAGVSHYRLFPVLGFAIRGSSRNHVSR